MREFTAAKFEIVRREIDNEHPALRLQNARRLNDGGLRILEVVQHLMKNREIESLHEGPGRKWQAVNVGEPNLAVPGADPLEPVARDHQHVGTYINAGALSDLRCEQLEHAPGTGAGVEYRLARQRTHRVQDCGFDVLFGCVQRTDALPVGRVRLEEGSRRFLPCAAYGFQPPSVGLERFGGAVCERTKQFRKLRRTATVG